MLLVVNNIGAEMIRDLFSVLNYNIHWLKRMLVNLLFSNILNLRKELDVFELKDMKVIKFRIVNNYYYTFLSRKGLKHIKYQFKYSKRVNIIAF